MSLEMNAKQEGMEAAENAIKSLLKLGALSLAAQLHSSPRRDKKNITNEEIVERLAGADRDFFSLGKDEGKAAQTVADTIVKQMDIALKSKQQLTESGQISSKKATEILAGALLKGLTAHTKAVVTRFKSQTTAKGGNPRQVSPEYAAERNRKFGVSPDKVGIATRDLLTALGSRDFRVKKI